MRTGTRAPQGRQILTSSAQLLITLVTGAGNGSLGASHRAVATQIDQFDSNIEIALPLFTDETLINGWREVQATGKNLSADLNDGLDDAHTIEHETA